MKFSQFLSMLNCYIFQDKTQLDFMYLCFQLVMVSPDVENDEELDEKENYYPFSKITDGAMAKKVYSGERLLTKSVARFVKSHFDGSQLSLKVDLMDDKVKENLCDDLKKYGILCDIDNVGEIVVSNFLRFIEAAIDECDTIQTGLLAASDIRVESENTTNFEVLFLVEAGNKCPLCGAPLMKRNGKGTSIKRYKLTQIFPDNVDRAKYCAFSKHFKLFGKYNQEDNLIALCSECSIEYLAQPTLKEFLHLLEIKKALQQRYLLQQSMDKIGIEDEIGEVIYGIMEIDKVSELVPLKMKALKIRQKIDPKNRLLIDSITDDVTRYYKYIEELFLELNNKNTGTFEKIAKEFRLAYLELNREDLSQDEIFAGIVNWIKRNLPNKHYNDIAISAVVSFFVQNCEVFDEISE